MVSYKCFYCGKDIKNDYLRKKVRCPYCGGKILYKSRTKNSTVKAR
ncbi:DNA-directed RNA polymerase subunit P [Candidatus Woesearchaeota archaeon]|nr:MAG: DNA-directed RNA polymerase subunit P [Candidatus Woesearchaeota archaeon]